MDESKNSFRSAIEPFKGKRCLLRASSSLITLELWLRFEGLREETLSFSRHPALDEKVTLELRGATVCEFGTAALAPPDLRDSFGRLFEAAARVEVEGDLSAVVLFEAGRGY